MVDSHDGQFRDVVTKMELHDGPCCHLSRREEGGRTALVETTVMVSVKVERVSVRVRISLAFSHL